MDELVFNTHNKSEFPPAHTAEHLLNQTMCRMFGCKRSNNTHIERKKSKINFALPECPTKEQIEQIEQTINQLIQADLPISFQYIKREEVPADVPIERLPQQASECLRLVRIGDYDTCLCIGQHVASTAEIGEFKITSTSWNQDSFRIVYRVFPLNPDKYNQSNG